MKCTSKTGKHPRGGAKNCPKHKAPNQTSLTLLESTPVQPALVKTREMNALEESALTSELDYRGEEPEWMSNERGLAELLDRPEPIMIDRIPLPDGEPGIVTWEPESLERSDQDPRGFNISRLSISNEKTGEKVAYLITTCVTDESVKRCYGDDDWTGYRYMADHSGRHLGLIELKNDITLDSGEKHT